MCGFVGFLGGVALHGEQDDAALLKQMADTIVHRGPDDEGYWFDFNQRIGMCHRRLAIVDLSSAGAQPMQAASGRYVIAFNGEIYNHLDLRVDLQRDGQTQTWRGHSDTETLLKGFEIWGIQETVKRVTGMFAFAVWDREEHVLTLVRDRLGEKPLYWGWQGSTLLFGSELKALKAHPAFSSNIDRGSLALLLRHGYIPAPHSIYQGISKLRAGHYVRFAFGEGPGAGQTAEPVAYWSMNNVVSKGLTQPFVGSESEAVDALEQQLKISIGQQMLADVPLGAFLSGGIDSSSIVALMQAQSRQPVRTFTIGFDEAGYDEAVHAKAVARHLGTCHTELYVRPEDALAVIPRLPSIFCEPFADSSQIPTFLLCQLARQHVTVALSGDAGDELFGGYNTYQLAPRIWDVISKLPLPLRQLLSSCMKGLPLPDKAQKLVEVVAAQNSEEFYTQLISHWKRPSELVIGAQEPPTLLNTPSAWLQVDSFAHWMMTIDTQTYMTDDILVKVDRAAMANSLETRVPMLDHHLVELAWRMPLSMKIRKGASKWLLREVLYRHVPRELIDRPKKGFSIPLGSWLRGPLRDWAEALLNQERLKKEGFFHVAPIRMAWDQHLQGKRDNSSRLWSILMFQAWLEQQQ